MMSIEIKIECSGVSEIEGRTVGLKAYHTCGESWRPLLRSDVMK